MKKKIVFVIESLHLGGAEKSLVTLLQNLDYGLYDVDVLIFSSGGIFREFIPKEVNIIQVNQAKLSVMDRLKFLFKRKRNPSKHTAQLFWTIVRNRYNKVPQKYDVAIAYNQGFATYFTAEKINAPKKIAWINTDYTKAGYKIEYDIPFYKQFSTVVTVSQEAFESFSKELQKTNHNLNVEIIKDISDKNIIEKQSHKPLPIELKDGLKILTVARLARPKGLELAIEACKILIQKGLNIHWYILGEGSERNHLEALIKNADLQNRFFLLGADANPYSYMKACDIYVQTSLFEGLGLTVIEASLLNKPIVSTNFPTVYGILEDGETGLIAEMSAESIASKIERLITDKNLKTKLIDNLSLKENRDKEKTLKQIEILLN